VNDHFLVLWLMAFISTVLVETPIYMLFLRERMHLGWAALVSLGLQMATHPVLWLVWPLVSPEVQDTLSYWQLVLVVEIIVTLVEFALLMLVLGLKDWRRALLASLVANTTSTVVGLLH